jgi:hypothetical protein
MLIAPKFANDIMHHLISYYENGVPEASVARHVYDNSPPESLLWQVIVASIGTHGPFSGADNILKETVTGWEEMLKAGGDFVPNLLRKASLWGFTDSDDLKHPCHHENYQTFMKDETGPTAYEWLEMYE